MPLIDPARDGRRCHLEHTRHSLRPPIPFGFDRTHETGNTAKTRSPPDRTSPYEGILRVGIATSCNRLAGTAKTLPNTQLASYRRASTQRFVASRALRTALGSVAS